MHESKLKPPLASYEGEDGKRVLQMEFKWHWAASSTPGREEILCNSPLGDEKENTSFPRQRE